MSLLAFERMTPLTQAVKYALAIQLVQCVQPTFVPNETRQAIDLALWTDRFYNGRMYFDELTEFETPREVMAKLEARIDKIQRAPHVPVDKGPQGFDPFLTEERNQI